MRMLAAAITMRAGIARRLARREEGQDLIEYGLVAALISIFAFAAVSAVGQAIYDVFWQVIAEGMPQ